MRESRKPPQRGRTRGTHARPSERTQAPPRAVRPAQPGATPPPAPDAARIWKLRPRSVRAKVVALLMVPVVAMMALWGLAAVNAAQDAWNESQLRQLDATDGTPLGGLIVEFQEERAAAVTLLSTPASATAKLTAENNELTKAAAATDSAINALRNDAVVAAAALANVGGTLPQQLTTLWSAVADLPSLRGQITARQIDVPTAENDYNTLVNDGMTGEQALATAQQSLLGTTPQALVDLSKALEMIARQDTVMAGVYASGTLDAKGYQSFVGAYYEENDLEAEALPELPTQYRNAFQAVSSDAAGQQLAQLQKAVLAAGPGSKVLAAAPSSAWISVVYPQLEQLGERLVTMVNSQVDVIAPYGLTLLSKSGAELLLGFAAVILSLLISVRVGRNLVLELIGLRDTAMDLAERRLPRSMARLRAGEQIDLAAEAALAPPVDDEVGQVAAALVAVHRSALEAAIERAEAVNAVSGVFLNLARRSQLLVHRQLALLDSMERRIEDPAELEDLFRLDHLATRMRRYAEGLIILSGATPGRGWRKPVPLMDVVRAAVAEVEDYARVEVRRLPPVHVAGSSVADLTHLIAELVENATVFSPPHTKVHIHGEALGSDFALQIHDEGLGMGEEVLVEANRRISSARQADLYDADRLGLFVVSRLARRLGLDVHLTRSPFGGTTALVMVPESVLEAADGPERAVPGAHEAPSLPAAANTRAAGAGANTGAAVAQSVVAGALATEQAALRQAIPRQTTYGRKPAPSGPVPPQSPWTGPNGAEPMPTHTVPTGQAGAGPLNEGLMTGSAMNGAAANPATHSNSFHGPAGNGTAAGGTAAHPPIDRRTGSGGFSSGFGPGGGSPRTEPPAPIQQQPAIQQPAIQQPPTAPQPSLPPRETGNSGTRLPRRIRQTHIAPQLRTPLRGQDTPAPASGDAAARARRDTAEPTVSPDQARETMAAFQSGWRQGRADNPQPGGEPAEPVREQRPGGFPYPDRANTEGAEG
jgi:signal transduction histidine kinase